MSKPFHLRTWTNVIIAIAVAGVFTVGSGLVGWQIFQSVQSGVPLWVWLVAGAALLYFVLSSGPAKATGRAAGRVAIYAGETYIGGRAARAGSKAIRPNHQLTN